MACNCGGGAPAGIAYRLTITDSEGTRTSYAGSMGEIAMLRQAGAAVTAVAVKRSEMDEWAAKQADGS